MFGLGPLITIAIYVVLAIAAAGSVFFAWQGFTGWVSAPYVQAQIEADAKEIKIAKAEVTQARADQAAAEQDKTTAERNEGQCAKALGTSETAKSEATKQANKYREDNRRIIATYEKDKAATAPRVAELTELAAATRSKAQTCEETLKKADDIVDCVLRQRRGLPCKTR